ncbi:MAG TPA: hypothetical protein PLN21_17485 [Gemmatales bacterium]|nr:hypothetical protein [Gemmatales bacterium]
MWDKVFRSMLILATLHLHAPLCKLHAYCCVPVAGNTSSEPAEDECECCKKTAAPSDANDCKKQNHPVDGSKQSWPCKCLCGIIAIGYVPLTPVVSVGLVHVASAQLNVSALFNKQDGFKEGIDRPPR